MTGAFLGLAWLAAGAVGAATAHTVSGTVQTPAGGNPMANGQPVINTQIKIMDEDTLIDDEVGSGLTDGAGAFMINFMFDQTEALPDIFVNVRYVGTAVDGKLIEVHHPRILGLILGSIMEDENVEGVVHYEEPAGALVIAAPLVTSSTAPNIIAQIGAAATNMKALAPAWMMPENVEVEARLTNGASTAGTIISIAFEDYNGPCPFAGSNASFTDMHHEFFHWAAYRAYGDTFPSPSCSGNPHYASRETCEGFAMTEGSAQYFGATSAMTTFGGDCKSTLPVAITWRGRTPAGAWTTGSDNTGEIVEGALERTWRANGDDAGNVHVLLTNSPNSMRDFKVSYAAHRGNISPQTSRFLNTAAQNGIVYTRGKLVGGFTDGFDEVGDPSNDPTMIPDGTFKLINGIATARGDLTAKVDELNDTELNLPAGSATDPATRKTLGYKTANAGLGDVATGFTFIASVPTAGDLVWDTTTVADQEYDVIIRLSNDHIWSDQFTPSFAGDVLATVRSDERWLKKLGTWGTQDDTPNDNEGKLVLDNTAPKIQMFKPEM